MSHQEILAVVSAVWVGSELLTGLERRPAARTTSHDRGSLTGGILRELPATTISHQSIVFWIGIALMLVGIAIRATAILTLRRFYSARDD